MLRHDGYISLCLNIRLVGITIHYCKAERINRILDCECVLVMADSDKRFTGEGSFSNRNSHDPVNPVAVGETPTHQPQSPTQPPNSGQGDLSLLKKKPTSFQITSVTVQGSRLSTDGGDDSADDLDESHTEDLSSDVLDLSRTTDIDNDVLSEDNSNNTNIDAQKSIPVRHSLESQPPRIEASITESHIPSQATVNVQPTTNIVTTTTSSVTSNNTKPTEPTNESATKAPTIPDQWQHRFKVVKIVSSQPYKRGRWLCMDFMDPPSMQSSEAKLEAPTESATNITMGSGLHAETAMCGTQTTNNVAHVYEIPPNESYPGSISVTVCPQPIQQPFYGIFLPLNNSQMPDMSAMPCGFAQDPNKKIESNVPSMQPITVGFVNQASLAPHMGSSMQQTQSYVSGSNKSYEENSAQSQSFAPPQQQQPQATQSQSYVPQQQVQATQSQSFVPQQQQPQATQPQNFVPQQQQQQPQVFQSQNFVPQQQQPQASQSQNFVPQQQQPQASQSQNFVPQQPQPQATQSSQSFVPQQQVTQSQSYVPQQQQPQVTQSQSYVPQQPQVTQSQSYVPQQQQPQVTQSQNFVPQSHQQSSHVGQAQSFPPQPQQQSTQSQSFIQQPPPQAMSAVSTQPMQQTQSASQASMQHVTHSLTDTSTMQVPQSQGMCSMNHSTIPPPHQVSSDQMISLQQPVAAVPPPAFTSQNLSHNTIATETNSMSSIAQTLPTVSTALLTNTVTNVSTPVNVPQSIPENVVISSNIQQPTSKETHNVPSQPYNYIDAGDNILSNVIQQSTEMLPETSASKAASTVEEAESAPSGSNTVAIDNKIEQAMDLVKSHLMFAVREEVDVLKEKITELVERISFLEYENTFLKANASQETLSQLNQSQQLQQQQQQQQTQNIVAAQGLQQQQPQQNIQNQQPTL